MSTTLDTKREEFHHKLTSLLSNGYVYYQPLESIKLSYPAIVYERLPFDIKHADNQVYVWTSKYSVAYISHVPDDDLVLRLLEFPKSHLDRIFVSDNLYYYEFTVYF